MRKMASKAQETRNIVKKAMDKLRKPATHRDRTKYRRKEKHNKGSEE